MDHEDPGTKTASPPTGGELFRRLRQHPDLFDVAGKLSSAYVDYVGRWPRMRTYIKDQAALALATVAVAQTIVGTGYTAGQFATVLSVTRTCSERRAVSMASAMRLRGDLVPLPDGDGPTRAQWLIASDSVCAFVFDRFRLEVASAAIISPIVRAAEPLLDQDRSRLHDLMVYVRTRFFMAYQQNDPMLGITQFFVRRDFGLYFLMFLIARAERDGDGAVCRMQISDAARRLGVSRAHVRKIIADAQAASLVDWNAREGVLTLTPGLVDGVLGYCATTFQAIIEGLQQKEWAPRVAVL